MNTWFILAQLLGLVTIVFEFISYQKKIKSEYFLATGIGSFFWIFMFVSIGMATGMATQISLIVAATYSTIRNLVFHVTFKKNTVKSNEFGLRFLLVMIVVALAAGIASVVTSPEEVRWIQTIGMITALGFVVCQYLPGVHYVRISIVFYALAVIALNSPLNILYGDIRWNFMGIAIELAKIISVIVFYVRYSKNPEKAGLQLSGI
jgi:hypothetical protein